MRVVPARADDLPAVMRLLQGCGLPVDLEAADGCVVLRSGTGLAGCVALEAYGRDALLRSLAVRPASAVCMVRRLGADHARSR